MGTVSNFFWSVEKILMVVGFEVFMAVSMKIAVFILRIDKTNTQFHYFRSGYFKKIPG
jgi:hypothetical protein